MLSLVLSQMPTLSIFMLQVRSAFFHVHLTLIK